MTKKRIEEVIRDEKGVTIAVRYEGNKNITSLEKAKQMVAEGKVIDHHLVNKSDGSSYIRSNPDGCSKNNLDNL